MVLRRRTKKENLSKSQNPAVRDAEGREEKTSNQLKESEARKTAPREIAIQGKEPN